MTKQSKAKRFSDIKPTGVNAAPAGLKHQSYAYALKVVNDRLTDINGEPTTAPAYVKKQCAGFIRIANGEDIKWCISERRVKQLDGIMRLLIMPKGLKAGQPFYDCLTEYQWLFLTAVLCAVSRKDDELRKYQRVVLEVCRKNFKTFTIGTLFIMLFLTEPPFSKFFSVAPDGSLSREVREAISETLKSSPLVYKNKNIERFKILRDYIEFMPTESKYVPLNYTNSRFDGRLPNAFLADEVGGLPNSYAIEAMSSGQLNIKNKLACIVSTKYPRANNPFEDEVLYAKKVLDGLVEDETLFALLYEPDNTRDWATDDELLRQANPAALTSRVIWDDLLKHRQRAREVMNTRENFITKHCNIIYQGAETESYIPIDAFKLCAADGPIDWKGKGVFVGVDLAMTSDNCSVVMTGVDDEGRIIVKPMIFIPEARITEKTALEKVDYTGFVRAGWCVACGEFTVDYGVIEKYVFDLEEKYGVKILGIGYDRYNGLSSASKWAEKYDVVEVRQHSDTLHAPTKYLYEEVMAGHFRYEPNTLYEINFENVRIQYDSTLRMYPNKKKSTGKIDAAMATIDAICLLQQSGLQTDAQFVAGIDEFLEE